MVLSEMHGKLNWAEKIGQQKEEAGGILAGKVWEEQTWDITTCIKLGFWAHNEKVDSISNSNFYVCLHFQSRGLGPGVVWVYLIKAFE